MTINTLRDTFPLDRACSLLSYVNGHLNDDRDDIIDDAQLYLLFCQVVCRLEQSPTTDSGAIGHLCADALSGYREPYAGARRRVERALHVMATAYLASRLTKEAVLQLSHLE